MKKNVLLLRELTKEKAGNKILNRFFLEVLSGEIVNLIGLEGSGKEEVCRILLGEEKKDSGEIWFLGRKYENERDLPVERSHGIFFIGNEELVIPHMSVAENMYIVEKVSYFQFSVPQKRMERQARELFERFGIDIAPDRKAKELNKYEICILRLMRAYLKRAELIVIDDILDDRSFWELRQLIELLNRFKEEGISILWINSYPDAITELADKVVVIQRGKTGFTFYHDEYDKERLLSSFAGRDTLRKPVRNPVKRKEIAFRAENLENEYFYQLTFCCHKGEILGIYDLQNKFSRELNRLIRGKRPHQGRMEVDGQLFTADSEYDLVRNKVGVVDGNKYQTLIFPDLSLQENLEMAIYEKASVFGGFISGHMRRYLERLAQDICEEQHISGNVRRVSRQDAIRILYNRWRLAMPRVLFCFQPFLRLDAVLRKNLEDILLELSGEGMGIIMGSADIGALTSLCDRILVVEDNKIVRQVRREKFTEKFQ